MIEYTNLGSDYRISRVINGGWQLSEGHHSSKIADPVEAMLPLFESGINAFDCADIYTGVEELIGEIRTVYKKKYGSWPGVKVHTKFVPDYDQLKTINKDYVERIIDRSLKRLKQERLDMVQFAWWTYDIPGWVETAQWLEEIRKAGKIDLLSLTNFNTERTRGFIDAGLNISTHQVQYSLLDRRPEKSMSAMCEEHEIQLLCYGTIAGGFLSEKWLGQSEPKQDYPNRSLIKYKLIIDDFGGWDLFQHLLQTLQKIAVRHDSSIANVATRYILNQPQVAAVIIGAKNSSHLEDNLRLFELKLDQSDNSQINQVLALANPIEGDVFDIERIMDGAHGRIMKYNLNDS